MPVTARWAYFDHAAVAPLPRRARNAMAAYADEAMTQGDTVWPTWADENEQLRRDFATFLTCEASEIALIPNTSFGINAVAEGIDWQPGDNIILPAGEFPSNRFPWLNQARHGVEVRIIGDDDDPAIDVDGILSAIDSRTRVVAASWVGYATGWRLDVDRFARDVRSRGAMFFLDAIQGLGVFPLDLSKTPIDFLAADGHKWLLGPEGAGVMMIRREHLASMHCVPVGWNSVKQAMKFSHAAFDLAESASRYEIGSQTMGGMRSLRQSLSLFMTVIEHHGRNAIAERVLSLAEKIAEGLKRRGAVLNTAASRDHRSGIVTFALPGIEPSVFRGEAARRDVAVSCRGIGVRVSVHAYNNDDDIDRLMGSVDAL